MQRISANDFIHTILPSNSRAWVVMIRVYIDDTGAEHFVGFGGFAGKADFWESLETEWLANNERNCISEFHAKEYPQLVPNYAAVVLKYPLHLIGRTIDVAAYKDYAPRKFRNPFGTNAFATSAGSCAARIFEWLQAHPEEDCALVVDCQTSYASSITDCINWEAEHVERNPLLSLTTLNEENKRHFQMRQVADLGANLTAKHTAAHHYGLRVEKDLSDDFFNAKHWLGIIHTTRGDLEKMADVATDPNWRRFYDF